MEITLIITLVFLATIMALSFLMYILQMQRDKAIKEVEELKKDLQVCEEELDTWLGYYLKEVWKNK